MIEWLYVCVYYGCMNVCVCTNECMHVYDKMNVGVWSYECVKIYKWIYVYESEYDLMNVYKQETLDVCQQVI